VSATSCFYADCSTTLILLHRRRAALDDVVRFLSDATGFLRRSAVAHSYSTVRSSTGVRLGLEKHVSNVSATCFRHLRQLRHIRRSLSAESATTPVHASVTSRIDYCNVVFFGASKSVTGKLQRVLNAAAQWSVARGSSTMV